MWEEREIKNWQRTGAQKVEGKRRRGRLKMKREDCVKRSEKIGRKMENNRKRRSWRLLIENTVRET